MTSLPFAVAFTSLTIVSAVLAGTIPVSLSMTAVFLFAGPHNWFEARYVLSRMPARAGSLKAFFVVSVVGIVALTVSFSLLPQCSHIRIAYAIWHSTFVFWVSTLVWMRSRTNPRFEGLWVWPVACFVAAGIWLEPFFLSIALIYLHPLMAVWLLDRELTRSKRKWRTSFRIAIGIIPIAIFALWWTLRDTPNLLGTDPIIVSVANQSADLSLAGLHGHFLISTHAFLEFLHYSIWIVWIPLVGMKWRPWKIASMPLARRSRVSKRMIAGVLLAGLLVVLVMWIGFSLDYTTTRSVYFSAAMLHVLAEIPLLLRML